MLVPSSLGYGHKYSVRMGTIILWTSSGSRPQDIMSWFIDPVTLPKASDVSSTDEWSWEVPDLSEGSPWYQARIASLRHVVSNLPDGDLYFVDGLEALQVHSEN
jgi:hypothetical protein